MIKRLPRNRKSSISKVITQTVLKIEEKNKLQSANYPAGGRSKAKACMRKLQIQSFVMFRIYLLFSKRTRF